MSVYSLVPFLSESDVNLPGSLKRHTFATINARERGQMPNFETREQLIHALKAHEKLAKAWNDFLEEESDPELAKAWTSLLENDSEDPPEYFPIPFNGIRPYYTHAIYKKFDRFLVEKVYSELSDSEKKTMEADFHSTRQNLYQRILAAKAERLKCDISNIRPLVPVHSLDDNETESKLCQLPDDVFLHILTRLENHEVFRTTLVCKKWMQFMHRYSYAFKRVEYAPTTHLITFTKWMNPSSDESIKDCLTRFESFAWSLMKWCCKHFQNLETLILKDVDSYSPQVKLLLKKCQNLKNLEFTLKSRNCKLNADLHSSKMEMLILDGIRHYSSSNLVRGAFVNSNGLRGFRGELTSRLIMDICARNSMAFSNLIALELVSVEYRVLETLSKIDQLKLRYLKIGTIFGLQGLCSFPNHYRDKDIIAFHNLLSRLGQLEVLISMVPKGLNYKTIQVLTMLQLDLKQAVIYLDGSNSQNQDDNEIEGIIGQADPQATIASFANMLVEKDSPVHLSAFELIVDDEVSRSVLQGANTGLSIYSKHEERSLYYDTLSLSHPVMRKQLGIDF